MKDFLVDRIGYNLLVQYILTGNRIDKTLVKQNIIQFNKNKLNEVTTPDAIEFTKHNPRHPKVVITPLSTKEVYDYKKELEEYLNQEMNAEFFVIVRFDLESLDSNTVNKFIKEILENHISDIKQKSS